MMDKFELWWQSLDAKQRRLCGYGLLFGLLFALLFGGIIPMVKAHSTINRKLIIRQERLTDMVRLERKAVASRDGGFRKPAGRALGAQTPISFIERIASGIGIKEKLTNVKPGPQSRRGEHKYGKVTFQMSDLSAAELVDLLFQLEKGGYDVRVLRFESDRKSRKEATLQVEMELEILL